MKFACRRQNVVLQQREMKRLILEAVSVRPALVTQTGRETENVSFRQLRRKSAAFCRLRVSDRKVESLVSLKDIHRVNIGRALGRASHQTYVANTLCAGRALNRGTFQFEPRPPVAAIWVCGLATLPC